MREGTLDNGAQIVELFGLEADAAPLLDQFISRTDTDQALLETFAAAACGTGGESWSTRRIAVLLLEHLAWRSRPEDLDRLPALLGDQTAEPQAFLKTVLRRIGRFERVHRALAAGTQDAWADFFHAAGQECRLTFAGWLWDTEAVMREIETRVMVTRGTTSRAPAIVPAHRWDSAAGDGAGPDGAGKEAQLVRALCAGNRIYWVTPRVGGELNALVEYPVNSASMTIKPPASDVEIQIKRSGMRGPRPFNVVFEKGGEELPSSHRLQGGSLGWLAKREARASDRFAKIYQAVHGEPCPCNRTVAISSVVEVPSNNGPVHMIDYLTESETFGEGFADLRSAMRRTTAASPGDTGVETPGYEGPRGGTLRFIAQAVPQQAIQIHTTSYRLEHVASWLTEAGMRKYLGAAGRAYSLGEARRFGCDTMDEALGGFTPSDCPAETYAEFVEACFRVPSNRTRADACFGSLMRQTGKMWGTLLGVRGYTDGESFVTRNSGIRSVWTGESWEVEMRFMDHDDMLIIGRDRPHFSPGRTLLGMSWDELHIAGGGIDGTPVRGIAGALREIYRVSDQTAADGRAAFSTAVKSAYRKTQRALAELPAMRELFPEPFIDGIRNLDASAVRFIESGGGPAWRAETREFLAAKGYAPDRAEDYVRGLQNRAEFVRKMAFLFQD